MKKTIFLCVALLLVGYGLCVLHRPIKTDFEVLRGASVTIMTGEGYFGSGTVTRVGEECYVLTCAHIFTYDEDEETFGPIFVLVDTFDSDGKFVDYAGIRAEMIRYSESEDIAVLRIVTNRFPNRIAFGPCTECQPGDTIFHVGSFAGPDCSNSLVTGIMSYRGRVVEDVLYDQGCFPVYKGASGGGVFNRHGELIGTVRACFGQNIALIIPARRINPWMIKVGLEFIVNPNVERPSDEALNSLPVISG